MKMAVSEINFCTDCPFCNEYGECQELNDKTASSFGILDDCPLLDVEEVRVRPGVVAASLVRGDRVRYLPSHVRGDLFHEDCQNGAVSSVRGETVFVKYDCLLGKATTGTEDWTSQGTKAEDLIRI